MLLQKNTAQTTRHGHLTIIAITVEPWMQTVALTYARKAFAIMALTRFASIKDGCSLQITAQGALSQN
jgi:hypothetical protein